MRVSPCILLLVSLFLPAQVFAQQAFKTVQHDNVLHCATTNQAQTKYHCTPADVSGCWVTGSEHAGSSDSCGSPNLTYCTKYTYYACQDRTTYIKAQNLGCVRYCR